MDNLITGSKKNIEHLEGNDNFLFINHDISKHIKVDESIDYDAGPVQVQIS